MREGEQNADGSLEVLGRICMDGWARGIVEIETVKYNSKIGGWRKEEYEREKRLRMRCGGFFSLGILGCGVEESVSELLGVVDVSSSQSFTHYALALTDFTGPRVDLLCWEQKSYCLTLNIPGGRSSLGQIGVSANQSGLSVREWTYRGVKLHTSSYSNIRKYIYFVL